MTHKILLYTYDLPDCRGVVGVALAEDGTGLARHLSTSTNWARHDLTLPEHLSAYAAHYPTGYELVWLGHEPDEYTLPLLDLALRLNEAATEAAKE